MYTIPSPQEAIVDAKGKARLILRVLEDVALEARPPSEAAVESVELFDSCPARWTLADQLIMAGLSRLFVALHGGRPTPAHNLRLGGKR